MSDLFEPAAQQKVPPIKKEAESREARQRTERPQLLNVARLSSPWNSISLWHIGHANSNKLNTGRHKKRFFVSPDQFPVRTPRKFRRSKRKQKEARQRKEHYRTNSKFRKPDRDRISPLTDTKKIYSINFFVLWWRMNHDCLNILTSGTTDITN